MRRNSTPLRLSRAPQPAGRSLQTQPKIQPQPCESSTSITGEPSPAQKGSGSTSVRANLPLQIPSQRDGADGCHTDLYRPHFFPQLISCSPALAAARVGHSSLFTIRTAGEDREGKRKGAAIRRPPFGTRGPISASHLSRQE